MTNNDVTLVMGANGKTGRRVAERLTALGREVRLGSRSGNPAFDWEDRETWKSALAGMTSAYVTYYPDLSFPGAAETVGEFAELAVATGTRRLVLLSGRGEAGAQAAEKQVMNSGADWTVVRAAFFAQNFEDFMYEDVKAGEFAMPAGNTREPVIDADDVADVAVAALTRSGHLGEVYEVTGPRLITFSEAASVLTEVLGRPVLYLPISTEVFGARLVAAGIPEEGVGDYADLFTEIMDGHNEYLTDGVQRALGRAPRDFTEYARDAAAKGIWD